jgi:Uma2 family endonuclease
MAHHPGLISQFAQHVEVFRRNEHDGASWNYTAYGPGEMVALDSLDLAIPIEEIYADIDFSEPLVGE